MKPITITLSPHDATVIVSFLSEFKSDLEGDEKCVSLLVAISQFTDQVITNITEEQFEDARSEIAMNDLLGRNPGVR